MSVSEFSGIFRSTDVNCVPAELQAWVQFPEWLARPDVIQQLNAHVRERGQPTALRVHSAHLDMHHLQRSVGYALAVCAPTMSAVSLHQCGVAGVDAWSYLFQCMAMCQGVAVLDLSSMGMGSDAASLFASWVPRSCPAIVEIDLSDNANLGDNGAVSILSVIHSASVAVQRLSLRNTGLRDIDQVLQYAMAMPSLCQIDLTGNKYPLTESVITKLKQLDFQLQKNFAAIRGFPIPRESQRLPPKTHHAIIARNQTPGRRAGSASPSRGVGGGPRRSTTPVRKTRLEQMMPTYTLGKKYDSIRKSPSPAFRRQSSPTRRMEQEIEEARKQDRQRRALDAQYDIKTGALLRGVNSPRVSLTSRESSLGRSASPTTSVRHLARYRSDLSFGMSQSMLTDGSSGAASSSPRMQRTASPLDAPWDVPHVHKDIRVKWVNPDHKHQPGPGEYEVP
eukprot:PhM_4_TR8805/c0_g1_i1/m.83652